MAGELQCDHETGRVVYYLIRNMAGAIWNGAAFEAYVGANYATYDVAATEQGSSGFYTANMPALAAGQYSVLAKERAGGAPAESDRTIGTGSVLWSGTRIIGPGSVDGYTFEEAQRLILAASAAKLAGAATPTVTIRDAADTKDRIVASVDVDGNRLAVTLDASE
jgi:hypothetical protein